MIHHKIFTNQELQELVQKWKAEGEKVVFTNGCFDLIHPGHVLYLEKTKALGDQLIVALNSDDSVRRLKGKNRPIQDEGSRSIVMAALASVDAVTIFTGDTPLALIKMLRPDVLAKGGDWQADQIVGGKEVISWGGQVKSVQFEEGHSTTNIEGKIRNHAD